MKNDSAFGYANEEKFSPGLTKREYFAITILNGLLANPDVKPRHEAHTIDVHRMNEVNSSYSNIAVRLADSLFEELERT